jgi:abortive infection bacteriophage resistance protein
LKTFLTEDELIEKMKTVSSLPLTFTTEEEQNARQFLRLVNYYSFSIFRKQLPANEKISYSYTECMELYNFNDFLNQAINKFTGHIEIMLRATLNKAVCQNYQGDFPKAVCYLDVAIYHSQTEYEIAMNLFSERVEQNKEKSLPITHHLNMEETIPLWVMVEELTFGELTLFLSLLDKEFRYSWVEEEFVQFSPYNPNAIKEELIRKIFSWFKATWLLRNITAHYSRLYGASFKAGKPAFFSQDFRKIKKYGKKKEDNKDLFAYLIAIKNLLAFQTPAIQIQWNNFLEEIDCKLQKSEVIRNYRIGFTENWKEVLTLF